MAKDMSWKMRNLKWDPWFEPEVETTIGIAWISFLDLPQNFFSKKAIFSIASVMSKAFMVDMAITKHTSPSCERVKVEVDLVAKLLYKVKINEENEVNAKIKSKWIHIQYDHKLKYCKECCL